jgi:ATP sulfurylase
VLDVWLEQTAQIGEAVGLWFAGQPLAVLSEIMPYRYDRNEFAKKVDTPFARYCLTPLETRVLFSAKGWRTIVGFQTRNVPHLGHEYVQKTGAHLCGWDLH